MRLCCDYRVLNANTVRDSFPLPNIQETLEDLQGSQYFVVCDLMSGYFQIPIDETSQEKTAIVTSSGLFHFNVMPQGLKNSPSYFMRVMNNVTAGLLGVKVYFDDTIVHAKTFDELLDRLKKLLQRFREHNLKCGLKKCLVLRKVWSEEMFCA